ncbi:MAG: hypothetical protein WCI95_07155 [bacterium]
MGRLLLAAFSGAVFACFLLISSVEAQMPPGMAPAESSLEGGGGDGIVTPPDVQGAALDVGKQRDPFWPVGYVPKKIVKIKNNVVGRPSVVAESTPEPARGPLWEEARKKVDIKGISIIHDKHTSTPKYIAMVAGKLVETGDLVTVRYEGHIYRWRVVGITAEGVSLQKLDARGE